ncbi:MAG TPA: anhydro-N-acetylmuramic acid kinase, partial [Cytophagales bacterium]|nr:anhydro-N-acetylmuramic acid kinase [Cytophagales bacterium]
MKKYYGIGLMSGTSLDGLDIAYVQFTLDQGWSYEILACETVPYDASLYTNLHECYEYRAHEFQKFHHKYG